MSSLIKGKRNRHICLYRSSEKLSRRRRNTGRDVHGIDPGSPLSQTIDRLNGFLRFAGNRSRKPGSEDAVNDRIRMFISRKPGEHPAAVSLQNSALNVHRGFFHRFFHGFFPEIFRGFSGKSHLLITSVIQTVKGHAISGVQKNSPCCESICTIVSLSRNDQDFGIGSIGKIFLYGLCDCKSRPLHKDNGRNSDLFAGRSVSSSHLGCCQ